MRMPTWRQSGRYTEESCVTSLLSRYPSLSKLYFLCLVVRDYPTFNQQCAVAHVLSFYPHSLAQSRNCFVTIPFLNPFLNHRGQVLPIAETSYPALSHVDYVFGTL